MIYIYILFYLELNFHYRTKHMNITLINVLVA